MNQFKIYLLTCVVVITGFYQVVAQNPIINDQFTADPTARIFDGKVYVYPSHDVNCGTNWFCMKDYHVFSSEDLVEWTDHGMILHQNEVPWVDSNANAMWAPDAMERNGTYYFYFPAVADTNAGFRGRRIGVATSDNPAGPFTPEPEPIEGVYGIDPNTFVDEDGQAYLYWSGRGIHGAELNSNMLEIESEPVRLDEEHPQEGLREGPFLFERNGVYYLTYPRVIENTEALVYATGDHPLGPFEYQGVFMDEHESGCWTNHHSIINYKGQWYLFYHHNDYSPDFDKNRSVRIDSLFFNPDGSIQKVRPTHRGVGITSATNKIQVDRYTDISEDGTTISFLNPAKPFEGWKTVLNGSGAWIRYNKVDFSQKSVNGIEAKVKTETGGIFELHIRDMNDSPFARFEVSENKDWKIVEAAFSSEPEGIQDIFIVNASGVPVEIDWIRFK